MKSIIKTAPLSAIAKSPLNVRRKQHSDAKVAEIAASILANGLLQPIVVHSLGKPKGKLGALAGEGRWKAILHLKATGATFDFEAIPVNHLTGTDAELKQASLVENYAREDMNPAEIYEAFRDMKALDPDVTEAQLAERFGFKPDRVARIMRLAGLHTMVFAAYRDGQLKDEQAFAYAATTDQDLQWQTFQAMAKRREYERHPRDIRAAMNVGEREQRRLLKFVTLEAYQAAGGVFEIDLFAQEAESGRVMDEQLLRRLVNEKLDAARAEYLARHPGEVTFVDEAPKDKYGSSYDFIVRPRIRAATDEEKARLAEIRQRQDAINGELGANEENWWDADGDPVEEHAAAIAALEAEMETLETEVEQIEDGLEVVPEGAKLAVLAIGDGGGPVISLYWPARPKAAASRSSGTSSYVDPAKEAGLSNDSAMVMQSAYRSIVQGLLLNAAESGFALDYLLFSQTKAVLNVKESAHGGQVSWNSPDRAAVGLHAALTPDRIISHLEDEVGRHTAGQLLATARRDLLAAPCFAHHDPVAGFELFQAAGQPLKDLCAGYLAGFGIKRSFNLDRGYGRHNRFVDYLGTTLTQGSNTPVRELWSPDATFLKRLAKKHKLAILERIGGPDLVARTKGLKADEITTFVERILRCSDEDVKLLAIDDDTVACAIQWLPDYLQFPDPSTIDREAPKPPKPKEPRVTQPAKADEPLGGDPEDLDDGEGLEDDLGEFEEAAE